jgi:hypothetical protein
MRLGVSLTSPSGCGDEVGERCFGLLPPSCLETTIGVDGEQLGWEDLEHGCDSVLDLLLSWNTRRVNVVDTWADLVGIPVLSEHLDELEVGFGGLDGDDVGVETLDGGEDVCKVRVAEVGVDLGRVLDARGCETERVYGPGEVVVPVDLAEWETLSDGRLVDLNGVDAGVLQVDDLVTESESELLGLGLSGDIDTGERPVEDGDGTGKHTLHWLFGEGLSVGGPSNGHWRRTRDVGDDDGGSDVSWVGAW